MSLESIRVLWRQPDTMALWGIPYDMRRARESYVPPRPGWSGSKSVDLSDWI